MDDDLRSLERQASQNDPDAMLRLYQIKRRSGDLNEAAVIGFQRGMLLEIVPESLIDLLARLRFEPAVKMFKQSKKRIQNQITAKLLDELGQLTVVKLVALLLRVGVDVEKQALEAQNYVIFDADQDAELYSDAYSAIDQLQKWQPGSKLPETNKKQIKGWIQEATDRFNLTFSRDSGVPYIETQDISSNQIILNREACRLLSFLEGIVMAYSGRLTNRTAVGYSREANTIIQKFFYQDGESGTWSRRSTPTEMHLSMLGSLIIPEIIDALLPRGEKIEKVPSLDQKSPEYYKREITGRRFTVVTFPKPYIETSHPEIGDKIYKYYDVIIWTADPKEALNRARNIGKHFKLKFSSSCRWADVRTHQYVQVAKELLEAGLEENQVVQPGFRPKATRAVIKDAENIMLCRAAFRGGKPEYLQEPYAERDKKLSKKERAQAMRDAEAFVEDVIKQFGEKIIRGSPAITFHEVRNLAINISEAVGVSFRLKAKDFSREVLKDLAEAHDGIFSSGIDRGPSSGFLGDYPIS